jgi:hypothetical protein
MTQSKKANNLPKTKLKVQIRNHPNLEHLEFQITNKEKLMLLLKIVVKAQMKKMLNKMRSVLFAKISAQT